MLSTVVACILGASTVSLEVGPLGTGALFAALPAHLENGMLLEVGLGVVLRDAWAVRAGLDLGGDGAPWSERFSDNFASFGAGVALLHRWSPSESWRPFLGGALTYRDLAADRAFELGEHYECPRQDCDAVPRYRESRHVVPSFRAGVHADLPLGVFAELGSSSSFEAVQGHILFEQRFTIGLGWAIGFGSSHPP